MTIRWLGLVITLASLTMSVAVAQNSGSVAAIERELAAESRPAPRADTLEGAENLQRGFPALSPVPEGFVHRLDAETAPPRRLVGERAWRHVYFRAPSRRGAADVVVQGSVRTTVNALPDDARIAVRLNGRGLTEWSLVPGEDQRYRLRFDSKETRPGINQLTFSTRLRHRVDCRAEATYELFAELPGGRTAISFDAPAGFLDTAQTLESFLYANAASVPLTLVRPATLSRERFLAYAGELVQGYGRLVAGKAASIEIMELGRDEVFDPNVLSTDVGKVIIIGRYDDLLAHMPAESLLNMGGEPTQTWFNGRPGQVAIAIAGRDDNELARRVRAFAGKLSPLPTVPRISGPGTYRFNKLGFQPALGVYRRLEQQLNFRLPPDYYFETGDQGNAALKLDYIAPTDAGFRLDIFVNDAWLSQHKLEATGARISRSISIPAERLRAGYNRIALTLYTPRGSEESCNSWGSENKHTEFGILDQSTLTLPEYSGLYKLPDIAGAIGGNGFLDRATRGVDVLVLNQGVSGNEAALNLLMRLAAGSDVIRPVSFHRTEPAHTDRTRLVVASWQQLPARTIVDDSFPGRSWLSRRLFPRGDGDQRIETGLTALATAVGERFSAFVEGGDPVAATDTQTFVAALVHEAAPFASGVDQLVLTSADPDSIAPASRLLARSEKLSRVGGAALLLGADDSITTVSSGAPRLFASAGYSPVTLLRVIDSYIRRDAILWLAVTLLLIVVLAWFVQRMLIIGRPS